MYYCSLVWPLGKTGSFYHFWDIMWFPFIVIHLEVFVTLLPPPHYSVCIELKASRIRSPSEWHFVFLLKHIITSGLLKFPMPWWGRRLALCFWGHLFQHGIVLPASCWTHLEADSALKEALAFCRHAQKSNPLSEASWISICMCICQLLTSNLSFHQERAQKVN